MSDTENEKAVPVRAAFFVVGAERPQEGRQSAFGTPPPQNDRMPIKEVFKNALRRIVEAEAR